LIKCLEVEVIKRLLWPLKELEAPFKNGKKTAETAKIASTILELEKSL